MNTLTDRNFGLLIAYVIPGLIVVAALQGEFPILQAWLRTSSFDSPTIGGFLYATIASVGAGLAVSALRWLIVDAIYHRTGIPEPNWNFEVLQENIDAFTGAVDNHYRYYQAYANTLTALIVSVLARFLTLQESPVSSPAIAVLFAGIVFLFFVASRDALRKYYARTNAILKNSNPTEGEPNDDERLASRRKASVAKQTVEWGAGRRPIRLRRERRKRN